ncbi:MAG: hypothetical protein QXK06_02145 [Candidatus Diapherotrites archaeon]
MAMVKCPKCGSTRIDSGYVSPTVMPPKYFSSKKKTPVFALNLPMVTAHLCLDCGYLEFYADTEKAGQLIQEK